MSTISIAPEPWLIQRECGGWLAVSPPGSTTKIGQTGDSEEDARRAYWEAAERHAAILSQPPGEPVGTDDGLACSG